MNNLQALAEAAVRRKSVICITHALILGRVIKDHSCAGCETLIPKGATALRHALTCQKYSHVRYCLACKPNATRLPRDVGVVRSHRLKLKQKP